MDIQTRKLNFIESFLLLQNESIIIKLENLLNSAPQNTISASHYAYNEELEQANQRIENGEFYTAEEAENLVNKWK